MDKPKKMNSYGKLIETWKGCDKIHYPQKIYPSFNIIKLFMTNYNQSGLVKKNSKHAH